MQEMNRNYANYKYLAGIWKNEDGSFVADLTRPENIIVTYGGGRLERSFILTQTNLMSLPGTGGMMSMFMMGNSGNGMVSRRYDNEDMQLSLEGSILKDGEKELYRIEECWHNYNDQICFKMTDLAGGNKLDITIRRDSAKTAEAVGSGKYQCECGQIFDSKFCPNCGKPAPSSANGNGPSGDEKQQILQHGWCDLDGRYKLIFKDNSLKICVTHYKGCEPVLLRIDTEYSFDPDKNGLKSVVNGFKNTEHETEEFAVYPGEWKLEDENNKTLYAIVKIWYGFGTLHIDMANWGNPSAFTVDLKQDDSVVIPEPGPQSTAGWTCINCGAENQREDKCTECGAGIRKELLFALSEYASTCPPRYYDVRVYKCDDKRLILDNNGYFCYISTDVIGPAYEIIRKHGIDKWEQYKEHMTGLCGGSQSVSYLDGDKLAGTSTEHYLGTGSAYNALLALFSAQSQRIS